MRKVYKRKRRSCALCKPHKMNGEKRWKARELQLMTIAAREMKNA